MAKLKVPNTYVIIFFILLLCTISTWIVPGGVPQTWQLFSALYEGFSQQSGIIAFVLIIGGAFQVVGSTGAMDAGIRSFIAKARTLERFSLIRKIGIGNIVIVLIVLLFGFFGAVFGISEETIAFVALVIPLAKSLGYDETISVCMVYVAAHVGFSGAMLNPFTVGIAQNLSSVPLFSGIEYRTFCWAVLMLIALTFILWSASGIKKTGTMPLKSEAYADGASETTCQPCGKGAYFCYMAILAVLVAFSITSADACVIKLGQRTIETPWMMWVCSSLFALVSIPALRSSRQMFVLVLLGFAIVFMVVGTMGYGWYLPEICALFLALAVVSGISAGYSSDRIAGEFVAGAKDIFTAALVIGLAAGIIVILRNGNVIDTLLSGMSSLIEGSGKAGALGAMYGIQTVFNLFVTSASAKAAVTMPVMAPFADMIGVSRQAMVLAFQFGDGFTNMITPCSGVLMAVLSVAGINYAKWFRFIWKLILTLVITGFLLLLPTVWMDIPGF